MLPPRFRRYVELRTSDAALFWSQPRASKRCILNFEDQMLAEVYEAVRSSPEQVREAVSELWQDTSEEEFYSVRTMDPADPTEAAARYLYLNQLSAPWKPNRPSPDTATYAPIRAERARPPQLDHLRAAADRLAGVTLTSTSALSVLEGVRAEDFLFVDADEPDDHLAYASQLAELPGTASAILAPDDGEIEEAYVSYGFSSFLLNTRRPGSKTYDRLFLNYELPPLSQSLDCA